MKTLRYILLILILATTSNTLIAVNQKSVNSDEPTEKYQKLDLQETTAALSNQISQDTKIPLLNIIGQIAINDKDTQVPHESFTKPNERFPFLFKEIIEDFVQQDMVKKNVLVCVGTYRALIDFCWADFDQLIMLDWDPRVLEFNRKMISDIKTIVSNNDSTFKEQMSAFEKNMPCAYFYTRHTKENMKYFWQDETQWQRLSTAVRQSRINVIQANLGDYRSQEDLFIGFNEAFPNCRVVLDISNVCPQYVPDIFKILDFKQKLSSHVGLILFTANLLDYTRVIKNALKSRKVTKNTDIVLIDKNENENKDAWYYGYLYF